MLPEMPKCVSSQLCSGQHCSKESTCIQPPVLGVKRDTDTAKSQQAVTTCSGVNSPCLSTEKPARIQWNELKAIETGKNSMECVKGY